MRRFIQNTIRLILKYKKIFAVIVVIIAVITVFNIVRGGKAETKTSSNTHVQNQKIDAPQAKAKQEINQTFTFPIGEENKIFYTIESAELQDEIIVKGQLAKSVTGKTFIVVTLKVRNDSQELIEVNTRDYIRLTLNGNTGDKIALEIHNDPVLVQPISTKSTRLGLPIKDTDQNLSLHVGEIDGEKKVIPIHFE